MEHTLLKDNVYLFLLAFYNHKEMPNFTDLSQMIGISRQTASKKVKKLLNNGNIIINQDNIITVLNSMTLDEEMLKQLLIEKPKITAVELEQKLFLNEDKENIIMNLGISNSEYYVQQKNEVVVYGIISEGVIKYVGSTSTYAERITQHIRKRPFLSKENFVILRRVDNNQFDYERQLIKLLQPEWNIMSK